MFFTARKTEDLQKAINHTDQRVTAMESQLGSITDNQKRHEDKIDLVLSTITTPKSVNWSGWAGVVIAIFMFEIATITYMQEYVRLSLAPIKTEVSQIYVSQEEIRRNIRGFQQEVGVASTSRDQINNSLKFIEEWQRIQDDKISILNTKIAKIEE